MNEEDEFKPILKKPSHHSLSSALPVQQTTEITKLKLNKQERSATVLPNRSSKLVEVVGTNTVGHPFQQHIQSQNIKPTEPIVKTKNDWSLDSAVVTARLQPSTKVTSPKSAVNNLTEKNYLQIIDNLTSRYTKTSDTSNIDNSSANQNKKVNNKNVKDLKDKRVKLEFINDLGLNTEKPKPKRKGTSSSTLMSQSINSFNIKSNENKVIAHFSNINNNKELNKVDKIETNKNKNESRSSHSNQSVEKSPRSFTSYSQTQKLNNTNSTNNSNDYRNKFISQAGLNQKSTNNVFKSSLNKKQIKSSKTNELSSSVYVHMVKPIPPKIRPIDTFTSSCKHIIFDINKSESNFMTPNSPTASLLTR